MTNEYARYLNSLPVIPDVASKILVMMERRDTSFNRLEEIVSLDPGLTARILKVANSALYARPKKVTDLRQAATLLGFQAIKNLIILVLGAHVFRPQPGDAFFPLFWKHALVSAYLARDLGRQTGKPEAAETAFTAGLIHTLGQAALHQAQPAEYGPALLQALKQGKDAAELERARWQVDHKTLGGALLEAWNFPAVFADTAREYGLVNTTSEHKQTIILVTVADVLAGNLIYRSAAPQPLTQLSPWLPFLGGDLSSLEDLQAGILDRLTKDPLFQECRDIFHFK